MTDPDTRSMATSFRGSGIVGYNLQIAVDATHHLIVEVLLHIDKPLKRAALHNEFCAFDFASNASRTQ